MKCEKAENDGPFECKNKMDSKPTVTLQEEKIYILIRSKTKNKQFGKSFRGLATTLTILKNLPNGGQEVESNYQTSETPTSFFRTNERTYERTNERTNENLAFFSIFGGALRAAAKNRKKCLTKNFAFFSIFGGVLRTAAKNRKKCLTKTWLALALALALALNFCLVIV